MLKLENVSVWYGMHEALHNVSLDAPAGKTTVILGANGAGKTTLLKAIGGLIGIRPGGKILFEGQSIEGVPPHKIVAHGIALVPEGRRLFGEMTVVDNLRLGAYTERARANEKRQLERMLDMFPRLAERRDQLARTMSGGEQQMLAIGRALMSRPKLLILDEPSMGLAPVMVQEIARIVRDIVKRGVPVVLVEQNAELALKLARYAYVLETGSIALEGPARELHDNEHVRRAYLGG